MLHAVAYTLLIMKYLLLFIPVALVFVIAGALYLITHIARILMMSIAGFMVLFFGTSMARAVKTSVFSR